ncbi:MAG: DUF1254 domain-containing protein [Halioglobus sp.]|nr:DUF1254 domain-containing protein [Halioglobus sp.]
MNKLHKLTASLVTAVLLAAATISAAMAGEDAGKPDLDQVRAIAEEGFIYGLPIVMNYAVMNEFAVDPNSGQFKAPFNHILNLARVATYKDTAVVTPNSDTPYSFLWLDLRAEPMVISVPEVEGNRYYVVQLVDGNTYNYGYIGTRATGNKAGSYMVVGPGWAGEKPAGVERVFESTTPFSFAVIRTQLYNPQDIDNVRKVQAGYKAQPLSAFLNRPAPPAVPKIDFLPANTAGIKDNFWQYLDAALEFVPVSETSKDIRAKLVRLGIGGGEAVAPKDISAEERQAIVEGMKAGEARIAKYLTSGMHNLNGWPTGSLFGDKADYDGDWLKRAAAVKAGLYGNDAIEAVYPLTRVDATGQELDGSKHNYTLTFPAGKYPPVKAFWSVTMYDGVSQLLIENPINRYLINSPMLPELQKNPDGSLTIYIQHASPGKDKESNWLPAPDGPIYMVLRLYWPEPATADLSILPLGKGTWAPPGVEVAK